MVARAQQGAITKLMLAAFRLRLDVMDLEPARSTAAGHAAAETIAREHLPAQPRRQRGRKPLGRRRVERAQELGVAAGRLDRRGADLDLDAGAVLRGAIAARTD